MTICRERFVTSMSDHWVTKCRLQLSDPLKAAWRQMADTFNRSIAGSEEKPWQVLQLPSGTGKSIGLAVYCSLLHNEMHPGVLIVRRLISQVDEAADLINELSGWNVALAYHSESRHAFADVQNSPVLVITHSAYEKALNTISKGRTIESNWDMFTGFACGTRKLTVIDEAPNMIESARLPLRDLLVVTTFVNSVLGDGAKPELALLNGITASLCNPDGSGVLDRLESAAKSHCDALPTTAPVLLLGSLREKLRGLSDRQIVVGVQDDGNRLRALSLDVLASLEMMIDANKWARGEGQDRTIHAARLMLPETKRPTVILDATAAVDPRYGLAADWVWVIPAPRGVRNYSNVKLHVSRGNSVGKEFLTNNGAKEWGRVYRELVKSLDGTQRVFVCCHKDVEPQLVGYGDQFSGYDVAHWYALDGRNDWQDHDTVVIFGLPYLDDTTLTSWIKAFDDPSANYDLGTQRHSGHSVCPEAKREMKIGHITVSVIQAINRVRCRKVVDAYGNCRTTDAYILLPDGRDGDEVLRGIIEQMPGIQVQQWNLEAARKRVKRSKHEEPLLRYLEHAEPGTHSVPDVMRSLDIPERTRNRLTKMITDAASELAKRLAELNVTYVPGGGRGCTSAFVKA